MMSMDPATRSSVRSFAETTRRFCSLLENEPRSLADNLRELRRAVAELHLALLHLPVVEAQTDAGEPAVVGRVAEGRSGLLPTTLYWDVFDPLTDEPGSPVANSITDDLGDIYADLKRGLGLFDAGFESDAAWHWRFTFDIHWGEHLVGLERALYWLARKLALET